MKTTGDYIGRFEEDFYADMNTAFIKNMKSATEEKEPITKEELAKMFGISLEQFEKEFQDGTIICTAEDKNIIVVPPSDKFLKVICNDISIRENRDSIELVKKLSELESTNLITDIFGTTKIGMINCDRLSIEEISELMRDATQEEQESVQEYIDQISEPTGINLYDLLGLEEPIFTELKNPFIQNNFENKACEDCSSNPKNGGTGICLCTLGQQTIY